MEELGTEKERDKSDLPLTRSTTTKRSRAGILRALQNKDHMDFCNKPNQTNKQS